MLHDDRAPHASGGGEAFSEYTPVTLAPRRGGWTAARQRLFLTALAETGSISYACIEAGISSRSAYRLRARPDAAAFAKAWDHALTLATLRLTTLAYERATRGTVKEIFRDGELVGHTRAPSDKILLFLLRHLLDKGAAHLAGDGRAAKGGQAGLDAIVAEAREAFPRQLAALTDHAVALEPLRYRDFHPELPGESEEDE